MVQKMICQSQNMFDHVIPMVEEKIIVSKRTCLTMLHHGRRDDLSISEHV